MRQRHPRVAIPSPLSGNSGGDFDYHRSRRKKWGEATLARLRRVSCTRSGAALPVVGCILLLSLDHKPMRCPFCRVDHDRVIDSRASQDGFAIRRRRECMNCKRRFTTYEHLEEMQIKVVKKGGVREPFSREKVRSGLAKACWKRPVSDEQIDALVSSLEADLYRNYDSEIESTELGELVMHRLSEVDQVAYVRFASVYREFKDARDFVDEIRPMLSRPDNNNSNNSVPHP